jgi:hypothetical protein
MGDHFSSPRVFDDPAADIADVFVFPRPEQPGRVVLVMTVFPRQLGRLSFKPTDTNANEGQNVLAIVIEADLAALLRPAAGPLLAVGGETVTAGGHPVRLEHTARAELKNFIMSDKNHDKVNLPGPAGCQPGLLRRP